MSSTGLLQDNKPPDAESHSCAEATGGNGASGCGAQESFGHGNRCGDVVEQDAFQITKHERRRLVRGLSPLTRRLGLGVGNSLHSTLYTLHAI